MEKNKKVLIISTVGLKYDGITSVIMAYLEAIDKTGLDIYVAGTIEVKEYFRENVEKLGCVYVDFPNRITETKKYMIALIKFIKTNKIEIVHAHGNSGTLAIEMLAAWFGGAKKRIAHSHNTQCNQIMADKMLRPVLNLFYTEALACGKEAGEWLFRKRKFQVIANGRNIEKYEFDLACRLRIRKELGIQDNEIAIGHVGGFLKQKNHVFLVEIYKEIRKLDPNIKLFMFGEGPLKSEIEHSCEKLNVHFMGTIDNIEEYLNAMDGMFLPSLFEGVPLVAIEWQINGIPCILSDVITKECVFTKNIQFFSLNNCPYYWAAGMLDMISRSDRKINSITGKANAIETKFDIKYNAQCLKEIYID